MLFKKIDVVHVANPPDFLLPSIFWLKFFNIKFVFDQHDISIIHFNSKIEKSNLFINITSKILLYFEKLSIALADLIIAPNTTCRDYEKSIKKDITSIVIRNSNKTRYKKLEDIPKRRNKKLNLGYIGFLGVDRAAGIENFKNIAQFIKDKNVDFIFSIIGVGPGINILKKLLAESNLAKYFNFYGWLNIKQAYDEIKNFDFGIVSLNYSRKGHYASSMKVMDYMCCGVPVCSLILKEQLITTNGIGIHTDSFVEMAKRIVEVYYNENKYNNLRKETLNRFNKYLCWEIQAKRLIKAYDVLFGFK